MHPATQTTRHANGERRVLLDILGGHSQFQPNAPQDCHQERLHLQDGEALPEALTRPCIENRVDVRAGCLKRLAINSQPSFWPEGQGVVTPEVSRAPHGIGGKPELAASRHEGPIGKRLAGSHRLALNWDAGVQAHGLVQHGLEICESPNVLVLQRLLTAEVLDLLSKAVLDLRMLHDEEETPRHHLSGGISTGNEKVQHHICHKGVVGRQPLCYRIFHEKPDEAVASATLLESLSQVAHNLPTVRFEEMNVAPGLPFEAYTEQAENLPGRNHEAEKEQLLDSIEGPEEGRLRIF
mmetsp:Transcript_30216/g.66061  ORF Transcript_30216/g.66061 Transcript_30216/m.66061 type:complete len:295 (+) Transcript_30216:92-976(+)